MKRNNQNLMTQEGIDNLKKELDHLIKNRRPEIIKQIQEAREQGDLSENADYDAAKNIQAQIEGRIKEIENILNNAELISSKHDGKEKRISIGSFVTIQDVSTKEIYQYKIVGSAETNPSENKISNECPLAKSILGKKVGDETQVKGIEDPYKVKILEFK